MAAPGLTPLLFNNGKQDQIFTSQDLLRKQIMKIIQYKSSNPAFAGKSVLPTIPEIEQTHLIFVKNTFRPFVVFGMEYSVFPANANTGWGGTFQFLIQQTGDFFCDMAVMATVTPPVFQGGGPVLAASNTITHVNMGNTSVYSSTALTSLYTNSGDVNSYFNTIYNGNIGTVYPQVSNSSVTAEANFINNIQLPVNGCIPPVTFQWKSYPGELLFDTYAFNINGNPIDSYPKEKLIFLRNLALSTDKVKAYNRLMGQQNIVNGTLAQGSVIGTKTAADNCQMFMPVAYGNQTPVAIGNTINVSTSLSGTTPVLISNTVPTTGVIPTLNMFIPLQFWFCSSSKNAIPSAAVSQGQRFINLSVTSKSSNLYTITYPNPLLDPTIPQCISYSNVSQVTDSTIQCQLYVNNIYIDPTVANIFVETVGFNLVRLHCIQQASNINSNISLSNFKWPTEYVVVGFRPPAQGGSSSPAQLTSSNDWDKFTYIESHVDYIPNVMPSFGAYTSNSFGTTLGTVAINGSTVSSVITPVLPPTKLITHGANSTYGQVGVPVSYTKHIPIITSLMVTTNGIALYNPSSPILFNSYLPYKYSPGMLCAPEDTGINMILFDLEPLSDQPTGYFNISRVKDFSLTFVLNNSASYPFNSADMIAIGSCLNFSVIAEGNYVIRYSN